MDRRDFTRHLLGAAAGLTGAAAPWSALGRTPAPAARSIQWQRAFDGLQADVPRRAMALRAMCASATLNKGGSAQRMCPHLPLLRPLTKPGGQIHVFNAG